jgi:hypothetical protein
LDEPADGDNLLPEHPYARPRRAPLAAIFLARGGVTAGLHRVAVAGLAAALSWRRLFYIVHSFFHFRTFFSNRGTKGPGYVLASKPTQVF